METFKDLFANYMEYNKALRTWFVTFGLGGVSIFLINDKLGAALKLPAIPESSCSRFLEGVRSKLGLR